MASVKICGLKDAEMVAQAADAGAGWIGFVFVPASPRAVTVRQAAELVRHVDAARPVALLVDPDDALVDAVIGLGISILQLHGRESPARLAAIKARTGAKMWKALGVGEPADLQRAGTYEAADRLLIDARPPSGADRTGGHGTPFDWQILAGWQAPRPWLLAGGLSPENVAGAIALTGARAVDVSSGVETAPGVKDVGKIRDFISAAKGQA